MMSLPNVPTIRPRECPEMTAYLLAVQDLVCASLIIQMQLKGTDAAPEFVRAFDEALQNVVHWGAEMERSQP